MLRNVFAQMQSINSMVRTHGSTQSKPINRLENFKVPLKMSLRSSHVKLSLSSSHEWIRCCHNGGVELEKKVLSKKESFVKEI